GPGRHAGAAAAEGDEPRERGQEPVRRGGMARVNDQAAADRSVAERRYDESRVAPPAIDRIRTAEDADHLIELAECLLGLRQRSELRHDGVEGWPHVVDIDIEERLRGDMPE